MRRFRWSRERLAAWGSRSSERTPRTGMKNGKKYRASAENIDREKAYAVEAAVRLVKESAKAKFDETVDLTVRLGVDPRHADQQVRGAVVLPHGIGKTIRVLAFVRGEKEKEAL